MNLRADTPNWGFNRQVSALCSLYHSAQALKEQGVRVVSCDEKMGIQAIERLITPMRKGQAERREANYIRHGTQCLIANFEIATGNIIAPSIGDTRKEDDFVEHIKNTVNTDPKAQWIFITDQLNIHQSSSLVEYVASVCGYNGNLEKKESQAFKKIGRHVWSFFLMKTIASVFFIHQNMPHASWLNQIEVWFSILARKLLKRLSVPSKDELKNKIFQFIEYFNVTAAKAFRWTYKGKSTT